MKRAAALAAYVACIVGANWAIGRYGLVPVGFGLVAPAGVYFVGVAFTARDAVQETSGRLVVLAAIAAGAVVSFAVADTRVAVASGVAFAISELADFAVYTPLRRRGWLPAVVASNIVGLVVDSWLFLTLAFGSTAFLAGQVVGKAWMTLAAVALVAAYKARRAAVA